MPNIPGSGRKPRGSHDDRSRESIIQDAKDETTGVEIAFIAVIRSLGKRVEELELVLEETKAKEKRRMNGSRKFPVNNASVEVTLQRGGREAGRYGRYGNQVMYSLIGRSRDVRAAVCRTTIERSGHWGRRALITLEARR